MSWAPRSDLQACLLLAGVSIAVYVNTLKSGFTFDDNFAVVRPKGPAKQSIECALQSTLFQSRGQCMCHRFLMETYLTPTSPSERCFSTISGNMPFGASLHPLAWALIRRAESVVTGRGQNIRSDQSHKSYRPLTILSFRLQRIAGQYFPAGEADAAKLACHSSSCACSSTKYWLACAARNKYVGGIYD